MDREIKRRAEDLLRQMTLEEKIGQMNQLSPSIVGGFEVPFEELIEMMTDGRISHEEFNNILMNSEKDFHEDDIRAGRIGSCLMNDPKKANELQKIALEESRLGIPLIIGFDVIHGFQTVFPIPLAEAGSFDTEVFQESAAIAAREARSHGIQWTFAPMLDIARDARWGRISESPGEDPYLSAVYGEAKVKGFQGEEAPEKGIDREHLAACLKHFVAYGAVEGGKDYNTVSMSKSMLHNGYLPPFKKAVEAGAMTAMAAFNDFNGVPCTTNPYLLRTVLKEEYGFEGYVVSDANAVLECVNHGFAEDRKDASVKAANAGMDMDMGTSCFIENLEQAVTEGLVSEQVIDDAVRRILYVKMTLGLFENPYLSEEEIEKYDVLPAEHVAASLEAAKKSIVLLKNEKVLPVKKETRIALAGRLADMPEEVMGAWAIAGRTSDCVSIKQGLENRNAKMKYYPCCGPEGDLNEDEISILFGNLEETDVIVAVLGETSSMSGEAASRADITLPGEQRSFLKRLKETGKPVVLCMMNGRPLALDWEAENIDAIVECWQLGIQMGNAVAEVLYGEYNPTGKLAATFPALTGQCPMYYNHPSTGRPGSRSKFTSRYLDAPLEPLYPFGYGLSYTTFAYKGLSVTEEADCLKIQVEIENTGMREGEETIQLYMQDVTASLVRPVKELKGFCKVTLKPGESKKASMILDKKDMGFYDDDYEYHLEDGEFRIYAGANARDCLMESIRICRFSKEDVM